MTRAQAANGNWTKRLGLTAFVLLMLSMFTACFGRGHFDDDFFEFSISANPGSQSVVAGKGAVFTVTVNPPALLGTTSLSTAILPEGMAAAFDNHFDVINGQGRLFVLTTQSTPAGTTHLTVSATGLKGETQSATVSVTVTPPADFSISVAPELQKVKPGASTNYSVSVLFGPNSGPVSLSTATLPPGLTAQFNSDTLTSSGTSVLTVGVDLDIPTSLEFLNVVASNSSGTITVPITVAISPANFSLSRLNGPTVIHAGGMFPIQIAVRGLYDEFPGNVRLSTSDLPEGTTATFNPTTVVGQGNSDMLLATDLVTAPGDYTYKIIGEDASGTNYTTVPLTILSGSPTADVFLGLSAPVQTVTTGDAAYFDVFVSGPGASDPATTLTVSADKTDVLPSLLPVADRPGVYRLIVQTYDPQTYSTVATITVTATSPQGGNQRLPVEVRINRRYTPF